MTAELEALADRLAPLIADRVADLLCGEETDSELPDVGKVGALVDAAEVARRFSVSRDYIYSHADELDPVRLGTGPKARLRFDPGKVAEALSARSHPATNPHPPRSRPRRRPPSGALLPIAAKASRT